MTVDRNLFGPYEGITMASPAGTEDLAPQRRSALPLPPCYFSVAVVTCDLFIIFTTATISLDSFSTGAQDKAANTLTYFIFCALLYYFTDRLTEAYKIETVRRFKLTYASLRFLASLTGLSLLPSLAVLQLTAHSSLQAVSLTAPCFAGCLAGLIVVRMLISRPFSYSVTRDVTGYNVIVLGNGVQPVLFINDAGEDRRGFHVEAVFDRTPGTITAHPGIGAPVADNIETLPPYTQSRETDTILSVELLACTFPVSRFFKPLLVQPQC